MFCMTVAKDDVAKLPSKSLLFSRLVITDVNDPPSQWKYELRRGL